MPTRHRHSRAAYSAVVLYGLLLTCGATTVEATDLAWATALDGLWSEASNWSPAAAPVSPADNATLSATGTDYTVTVTEPTNVGAVVIDSPNATLRVDQASFSAAGGLRVDQGNFVLAGNGAAISNTRIEGAAGPEAIFLSGRLIDIDLAIDTYAHVAAIEGELYLDDVSFGSAYGSLAPGSSVTGQGIWQLGFSNASTPSPFFFIRVPVKSGGDFTLGPGVTLQASPYLTILESENASTFINQSAVTAATPNSEIRFDRLQNDGAMYAANGGRIEATILGDVGEIEIGSGGFVRLSGTLNFDQAIVVGDGAELSLSSVYSRPTGHRVTLQSGGKVYLPGADTAVGVSASGGVVVLNAPYTVADLQALSIGGTTTLELGYSGSLDLQGATLDYTSLAHPLQLSGEIRSGTYTGPEVVQEVGYATFTNLTMDVPTRVIGTAIYDGVSTVQKPVEVDGGELVLDEEWSNAAGVTVTTGKLVLSESPGSTGFGAVTFHGGQLHLNFSLTLAELQAIPFTLPDTTVIGYRGGGWLDLEGGAWNIPTAPTNLIVDYGAISNGSVVGQPGQPAEEVFEFQGNASASNVTFESLTLKKTGSNGTFSNTTLKEVIIEAPAGGSVIVRTGVLENVTVNGKLVFDDVVDGLGHLEINDMLGGAYRNAILRLNPGATVGGTGVIGNTQGRGQGTTIEISEESFSLPAGLTLISATQYDSTSLIAAPATDLHVASAIVIGYEDPWVSRSDSWTFQTASLETTGPIDVNFDGRLAVESGPWVHAGVMTLDDGLIEAESLSVAPGGAIVGHGAIVTTGGVVVEGELRPGAADNPGVSAGTLTFESLQLANSATLEMEIGGAIPGAEHDLIDVAGLLSLGGALKITLIDGFMPIGGDSFVLFDFGSVDGDFNSVELPNLPGGLSWDASSLASDGALVVVGVLLAGDYNEDGVVDAMDYAVWRENLGATAGALPNDPTGGAIGAAQLATWRANYGAMLPASPPSPTPEPTTTTLMLSLMTLVPHWRRRSGN